MSLNSHQLIDLHNFCAGRGGGRGRGRGGGRGRGRGGGRGGFAAAKNKGSIQAFEGKKTKFADSDSD